MLSLIEIGLGSLLHSFKIPLAGHFMSINQNAMLARISFELKSKTSPMKVSNIAAILKSLSPAGKKLTPMLAICAQGLLFSIGILTLGINYIGLFFSVILSSSWAFIQPVLFIYFLFGQKSLSVASHFIKEFSKVMPNSQSYLVAIIILFFIVKILMSYIFSIIMIKMSPQDFELYQRKMMTNQSKEETHTNHNPYILALKDLLSPLFIFSFLFTLFFFFFSHADTSVIFWAILRPLALGYILFFVVRVYPLENISRFLNWLGLKQMAESLKLAIEKLKEFNF